MVSGPHPVISSILLSLILPQNDKSMPAAYSLNTKKDSRCLSLATGILFSLKSLTKHHGYHAPVERVVLRHKIMPPAPDILFTYNVQYLVIDPQRLFFPGFRCSSQCCDNLMAQRMVALYQAFVPVCYLLRKTLFCSL